MQTQCRYGCLLMASQSEKTPFYQRETEAYLACSVKAMTPATSGVEALVPVNPSVH